MYALDIPQDLQSIYEQHHQRRDAEPPTSATAGSSEWCHRPVYVDSQHTRCEIDVTVIPLMKGGRFYSK